MKRVHFLANINTALQFLEKKRVSGLNMLKSDHSISMFWDWVFNIGLVIGPSMKSVSKILL